MIEKSENLILEKLIKERRSIRKFKKEPVSQQIVAKLIEAGTWAPSACNFQAWDFIVVDNQELKEKLIKAGLIYCLNQAPLAIFVCYDQELTKENFANIQSAAAAIQNIILTAHSLGLGSLWATSMGEKQRIKEILNIPERKELIGVVILGWPDEEPVPPRRKKIEEVIHYNLYNQRNILPSNLNPELWTLDQISRFRNYKIRSGAKYNKTLKKEFKEINNFIKENINGNKRWLDIFPFSMVYLAAFANSFPQNTFNFLALSEEQRDFVVRQAEETNKKIKGYLYPKENPSEKFNIISILFQLEGISSSDRSRLLKQVFDLLDQDGRLIVVFNNKFSYFFVWAILRKLFRRVTIENVFAPIPYLGPYQAIQPKIFKKQLRQAGFEIIKEHSIFYFPPFEEINLRLRFLFSKNYLLKWMISVIYFVFFVFLLPVYFFKNLYKTKLWILQKK